MNAPFVRPDGLNVMVTVLSLRPSASCAAAALSEDAANAGIVLRMRAKSSNGTRINLDFFIFIFFVPPEIKIMC